VICVVQLDEASAVRSIVKVGWRCQLRAEGVVRAT
jgi:hypothetical protein